MDEYIPAIIVVSMTLGMIVYVGAGIFFAIKSSLEHTMIATITIGILWPIWFPFVVFLAIWFCLDERIQESNRKDRYNG